MPELHGATGTARQILVVAHGQREAALDAARRVIDMLRAAGVEAVVPADLRSALTVADRNIGPLSVLDGDLPRTGIDLAIVLGGDGTILRAVELVRGTDAPILGINMGHVGFLAESESDVLNEAVSRALAGDYTVEERMTLSVRVKNEAGDVVYSTWALNEAVVEKASREKMIEVAVEVDGRPVSSFGCDGMVVSTPTGSTAYNFSAGGPIIWPTVEAIAVVPLSAHALFARPLVVAPETAVAIELVPGSMGEGVLFCDGRRSFDLPPRARVVTRRGSEPVRFARLHEANFADRLVKKFRLPVNGWRGQPEDEK